MKVLLLAYMPRDNASARNRVFEYLPFLERAGIEYAVAPPFPSEVYARSQHPRNVGDRLEVQALALRNRLAQVAMASKFDAVVIQRELMLYGPPWLERAIIRRNPNVVYDFDDATWGYAEGDSRSPRRFFVDYDKVRKIARVSKRVIAATSYLGQRALAYNRETVVIPDPIDISRVQPKRSYAMREFTVGWIGNPFNLHSLDAIGGALRRLGRQLSFTLKVVSSADYQAEGVKVLNKRWSLAGEAADLRSFDVGIMPLRDSETARGKGSIKAIMCMAAGVPVVCSPVGENVPVVGADGERGCLAASEDQWVEALALLAGDTALRQRQGRAGRRFVEQTYPPEVLAPKFIQVMELAASQPRR